MSGIFSKLFGSKFPDTAKYESKINNLRADFERFQEYEGSNYHKRFLELDKQVHSGKFEKMVKKLKTEKFKDTEQYRKQKNFKTLKRSKDIKSYFKFKNSGKPERIDKTLSSDEYQRFIELKNFVGSSTFQQAKATKGFKKTAEFEKLKEFKKLRKIDDIRFVNRALNSTAFKNYEILNGSERISNYNEELKYINSKEFLDFKAEMEDKDRFKKSEEYSLLNEYKEIKKTPEFIWYTKIKKENLFDEVHKWDLSFSDEFDSKSLDASRWITGYFWGKALLNDNYVLAHEKQFFQDSNVELRDSMASIVTKREDCNGKIWDKQYGFMPAEFQYSSGLISTGQSFRQKYGKFEAKIRLNHSYPVTHSFWMVSEMNVPQIDILRYNSKSSKKIKVGYHLAEGDSFKNISFEIAGANFSDNFFIFSLEWTPEKLTWKINGKIIKEVNSNIPEQPMYLVFSSHLLDENTPSNLPTSMDIDWVRCYKPIEQE